ncbi:hypothetical protein [Nocardiopsis coralliicola]
MSAPCNGPAGDGRAAAAEGAGGPGSGSADAEAFLHRGTPEPGPADGAEPARSHGEPAPAPPSGEADERFIAALRSQLAADRGASGPGGAESAGPASELAPVVAAAFRRRRPDAAIAALSGDSAVAPIPGTATVRSGPGAPRFLVFTAPPPDRSVRVQITEDGGLRHLAGRLDPPSPGRAVLDHAAGTTTAELDPDGVFVARSLPRGPLRILFESAGLPPFTTEWTAI